MSATLNGNLHKAKRNKNDEFYTQLDDIENELRHYNKQFRNKTVYCNCDDPNKSNFVKYFMMNFNKLGLKKLIATHYKESTLTNIEEVYKLEYTDKKKDITKLKGNGDFRSEECIELLKESDVIVTNPPFSLFREYVAQLMEYGKDFLIIGSMNAITYKEIFPLIKDNKIWLGYGFVNGNVYFTTSYDMNEYKETGLVKLRNLYWYTNLEIKKQKKDIELHKKYSAAEYPKYDNYDAINVNRVANIPMDYDGVMGVPITFIDKHNPNQFKLLGCHEPCINIATLKQNAKFREYESRQIIHNGRLCQKTYHRVFIKNKKVKK